jgi:hypothetical protein
MELVNLKVCSRAAFVLLLAISFVQPIAAQTSTTILRGQVTDPSGAVVADVSVVATDLDGQVLTATTGRDGIYEMKNLAPGAYKVQAIAKGFAIFEQLNVTVVAGQTQKLDIALEIEKQEQKVVVSADAPNVDVNPANNAGAVVISGKELDALSDDPDELQTDLEALAGPSAGPNGGQMYIDGFTAGQLPPKSSIREIRINQNPFSSEYDKLGYGRIEIFTKPGTDKFHGQVDVQGNDKAFNAKNPFLGAAQVPGYDTVLYNGNVGGPVNKKASFFFDFQRRDINDMDAVNATVLNPTTFAPEPDVEAVPNKRTRTNLSPRLDYQLSKNNTLSVRYQYWGNNEANDGVGQLALPTYGYNDHDTEQTLQAGDTQIFGSNVVNETRFQYIHGHDTQTALNPNQPTINVAGAFTGGGNGIGVVTDNENHYEFQNYTSWVHGKHILKFGARIRETTDWNSSSSGFNGTFAFPSLAAYQQTEIALSQGLPIPAGAGPSQLTITQGIPAASVSVFDSGLYVQDDWRVRPNITLSGGLRLESQNHINDHADWAPRVALAWGLARGKNTPKTVLRAGWGMFYDRFSSSNVLQTARFNGTNQNQYTLYSSAAAACNPDPTTTICVSDLSKSTSIPAIYQIGHPPYSPNFRSPFTMQTAVSLERQLTKIANLAVTYMNSRGEHQLFTDNVNTPSGFDPNVPGSGTYTYGTENLYEYISQGMFKQNQLIVNSTIRAGAKLTLFGYYTLNYSHGLLAGGSPSNPFNLHADYGRSPFDVRHRAFVGGSIGLPYGFRISPFMMASSGQPYSVTLSKDLLGSGVTNQRPSYATSSTNPNYVVNTTLGNFDANPGVSDTPIPTNDFTGPNRFTLNARLSKTFGFGKKADSAGTGGQSGGGGRGGRGPGGPFGGGGGFGGFGSGTNQRYNLTLGINARNLFNNVNKGTPFAILTPANPAQSALVPAIFGQSIGLAGGGFGPGGGASGAANRAIYLQATFSF